MPRLVFGRLLSSCLCFGAASIVFTVAGCGGGDEAESSTAQTATASSGSSAPAAPADGGGGGGAPMAPTDNSGAAAATGNVPMAPDSGETPGAVGAGMAGAPGMSGPPGMSSSGAAIGGAPGMSPESGGYGMAPGGYPGYPGGDGLAGGDGYGGAPIPGRPANVTEWSDEDLKSAVMERDRRVLEAIASRVKKSPGDQKVAELLVALIAASNEAPKQPAASTGAGGLAGPGSSGYGSAPMMPGMSSGMQPPGMSSGMQPGAGMSPLGAAPISGAPGMSPPKGGMSSPPGGGNAAPPQSSIQRKRRPLDSLNAMILESATAWQQPGVGAMAGRMQAGGGKIPGGAAPGAGAPSMDAGAGAAGGLPTPPSLPAMPGMSGPGPGGGMSMPGMPGMNSSAPATGALTNEELVQGLADGLVQNKSQMAWQTLFAIVAGNMKTPLSAEENARVVVLSLCRNFKSDPTTIAQVLTALIDGSAPIPGESRNACYLALATVSGQALDGLTGLQAGAVAGLPGTSGPGLPGSGMMMPGMGPGMGSAPGMTPGMGPGMAPGMTPGMGPDSGGFIESDGSGMPAPAGPMSAPIATATAIAPDQLKAVSQILWGDVCVNAIIKNLKAVTDPASGEALLAFAGSIPNRKVREAELEFLTKFHSAGADSLNSSGVLTSLARDPGMLVILKALPRGKAARGDDKNQLDSWGSARQSLALSLRDQLRAASAGGGRMKSTGDSFPVKLHKGGEAEYSGVLTVSAAELGGAKDAEFKVYYARTSFSAQKPRDEDDMISHYEQKASGKGKLDQSKGLFWIDGVKTAPNGVRRSMDIFIGTAGGGSGAGGFPGGGLGGPGMIGPGMGGPGGGGGSGASVPVEIIVVEMMDPKVSTENAATVMEPAKR